MRVQGKRAIVTVLVLGVVLISCAIVAFRFLRTKQPNVIMLMLDTLRADHLGYFGYERATSPNIDAFARESLALKYVVATAPWTPTSVATMFTGMYASSHGMLPPRKRADAQRNEFSLRRDLITLPEILKAHGYATSAISTNPWISATFGFERGFDDFKNIIRARANKVTDEAILALNRLQKGATPFFLYTHYLDPHDTYDPPSPYRERFSGPLKAVNVDPTMIEKLGLYDGEIAFLDHELGRLFEYLKQKGLYDDTVIIVLADHGEQFLEHGATHHGKMLHNEEVHVPMFFKIPQPAREVDYTVSLADFLPTLLDVLKIERPKSIQGISLLDDENSRARQGVFSEISSISIYKAFTRFDGKKIIFDYGAIDGTAVAPATIQVFDAWKDRNEATPLHDEALERSLIKDYQALYDIAVPKTKSSAVAAQPAPKVSDETLDQLKSMGYLQ